MDDGNLVQCIRTSVFRGTQNFADFRFLARNARNRGKHFFAQKVAENGFFPQKIADFGVFWCFLGSFPNCNRFKVIWKIRYKMADRSHTSSKTADNRAKEFPNDLYNDSGYLFCKLL